MSELIIGVTGHRPNKLGGYNIENEIRVLRLANSCIDLIQPLLVYTGMALGFDQKIALACLERSIPYVAVLACENQEQLWSAEQRAIYRNLLGRAKSVIVSGTYCTNENYLARNRYIVDRTSRIVCLYNGDKDGGTAYTVEYANKQEKPVTNLWEEYQVLLSKPV